MSQKTVLNIPLIDVFSGVVAAVSQVDYDKMQDCNNKSFVSDFLGEDNLSESIFGFLMRSSPSSLYWPYPIQIVNDEYADLTFIPDSETDGNNWFMSRHRPSGNNCELIAGIGNFLRELSDLKKEGEITLVEFQQIQATFSQSLSTQAVYELLVDENLATIIQEQETENELQSVFDASEEKDQDTSVFDGPTIHSSLNNVLEEMEPFINRDRRVKITLINGKVIVSKEGEYVVITDAYPAYLSMYPERVKLLIPQSSILIIE